MAKTLHAFTAKERAFYHKTLQKVWGGNRQTKTFKKWERKGGGGGGERMALGLAQGAVVSTDATFTGDNFTIICGQEPATTETVENHFAFDIDDNGKICVVYSASEDKWYCIQAACPA